MTYTADKAERLAKRLNRQNQKGRSWRSIVSDYPAIVKAGTLDRIAKSGGAWLPKKKEILIALGIVVVRKPPPPRPPFDLRNLQAIMEDQLERLKRKITKTKPAK